MEKLKSFKSDKEYYAFRHQLVREGIRRELGSEIKEKTHSNNTSSTCSTDKPSEKRKTNGKDKKE